MKYFLKDVHVGQLYPVVLDEVALIYLSSIIQLLDVMNSCILLLYKSSIIANMAVEHTLAEQKGHTMMHTYIYIHPLTNVPTKCQPSAPYGIHEKPRQDFKTDGHYDKVKGEIKVTQ